MLKQGIIIAGKYRIEGLVGEGGMGAVYQVTHTGLRKKMALKVLSPEFLPYRKSVDRFLNEAIGVADIHHRHIIDIVDAGNTEDGRPFFVMELLRGETLKGILDAQGKLEPRAAALIMVQVLSGLSVLHGRNILHRDIKPSNIFISREDDGTSIVKILDFGVSRFHFMDGDGEADMTTTESIIVTPGYMSPEMARGKKDEVDHRSDLYSCGVVLYRTAVGFNPFDGETYNEVLENILDPEVQPPSSFLPGSPPPFDAIVMKGIHPDRERRYQDCAEFMRDLGGFIAARQEATDPGTVRMTVDGEETILTVSEPSGATEKPKRRRLPFVAVAALLVAALLVAAAALLLMWAAGLFDGKTPSGSEVPGLSSGGKGKSLSQASIADASADAPDVSMDEEEPEGTQAPEKTAGGDATTKPEKSSTGTGKKDDKVKIKYFLKSYPDE